MGVVTTLKMARDLDRFIYRYQVPVDDEVHAIQISGPVLYVACRDHRVVEFWAENGHEEREFIVVGTGHPLPVGFEHVGTAISPAGTLVWHLMVRSLPVYF